MFDGYLPSLGPRPSHQAHLAELQPPKLRVEIIKHPTFRTSRTPPIYLRRSIHTLLEEYFNRPVRSWQRTDSLPSPAGLAKSEGWPGPAGAFRLLAAVAVATTGVTFGLCELLFHSRRFRL